MSLITHRAHHFLRCVPVLLALSLATNAVASTPEQTITAFFGPEGIPNRADFYSGEMLSTPQNQPTLGETLPGGIQVTSRPLQQSPSKAIFAVALSKNGQTQDWYAYLVQEGGRWKLEAVRCLALTAIPGMLLQQLMAKPQRTEGEEWSLQNLRLQFQSDANLRSFVREELASLGNVVALSVRGAEDQALAAARKLHISKVEKAADGRVELIIGGMVDNTVGLMFVPAGQMPPPMSADNYIYVEHVTDGWYVFKTT
jgi:hypothetical protein